MGSVNNEEIPLDEDRIVDDARESVLNGVDDVQNNREQGNEDGIDANENNANEDANEDVHGGNVGNGGNEDVHGGNRTGNENDANESGNDGNEGNPIGTDGNEEDNERNQNEDGNDGNEGGDAGNNEQGKSYIWNTGLEEKETRMMIWNFLRQEPNRTKFAKEIRIQKFKQIYQWDIDAMDIHRFDEKLYEQLVRYPSEMIPFFDEEVSHFAEEIEIESDDESEAENDEMPVFMVRIFNLKEIKRMRDLGPCDIDKLASIQGMVTRVSDIIPDLSIGLFQCSICQGVVKSAVRPGGFLQEPRCPECTKDTMELIHNRSSFHNKQLIKLQETPESIPEGETPHTVSLNAFEELVDKVKPGDRITIVGIFRAVSSQVNPRQRKMRNLFKTYLDVIHFEKSGTRIAEKDDSEENAEFTEDDISEIHQLSLDRDVTKRLVESLAPAIFQMDDVKKGILCQLFGGTNKVSQEPKIRGDLHILLVGDPGLSKSQLLIHVNELAPRGIFTSGKGSSAVGLTAYISKDLETGEYILESGALVLSDLGVCCIDEFDKMADQTKSILHEVMEQQTVSVAKAGIICSLNARTSILAAANPIESRYNENLSVVENLRMMPTLLSRFDLIYILRDIPNPDQDKRLAKHIISMYYEDSSTLRTPTIDLKLLTKYISYAKKHCHPKITNESAEELKKIYIELRKQGRDRSKITVTTRQLESLIRLSEAHAKMRLSDIVETEDVLEAKRLIESAAFEKASSIPLVPQDETGQEADSIEDLEIDDDWIF